MMWLCNNGERKKLPSLLIYLSTVQSCCKSQSLSEWKLGCSKAKDGVGDNMEIAQEGNESRKREFFLSKSEVQNGFSTTRALRRRVPESIGPRKSAPAVSCLCPRYGHSIFHHPLISWPIHITYAMR